MTNTESSRKIHHGRNIKRFREMLGLKQEDLALELGDDLSQKKVSRLEENERVEDEVLEQVAKILKVPVEASKNFDEQVAINIISNTFHEITHDIFGQKQLNGVFTITPNLTDQGWKIEA